MDSKIVKTRILVVDDSPEILQIFSSVLRANGYEVLEASDGMEALHAIFEYSPDLVVLDVVLPDMSGIEICKRIKTDPRLENIFVVLVSGHAMSVTQKIDGLDTGADDYLVKPMALSEFVARIRTMVRLQQTNAALRASEEHYRRLLEILPDAVGLIDLNGRVMAVNTWAVTMLGYDNSDELKGKRAFKMVRRRDWGALSARMRALLTTEVMWNAEYVAVKRDGAQFPVDINATTLTDAKGTPRGVLLVARDLSQRNQAREALERSQRLFKAILDNISDAAWLKQADGRFLACNEAVARFYGRPAEEIVGKTVYELSPFNAATLAGEDDAVIQTRKSRVTDNQLHNSGGTTICFEIVRSPVFGENGEVTGIVGIAHDVTERRWAENLLQVQRDFGIFLSSANDMKSAVERLLEVAMQYEEVDCGGVYLADTKTEILTLEAHRGLSEEFLHKVSRFSPISKQSNSVQEVRPVDWLETAAASHGQSGLKSVVSTPIQHGGKIVAVLNLGSSQGISNRAQLAIETIAAQAGDAIARIRVEQSLQANRQLLEKTLHSIRSAVFVVDATTDRILECNPAASVIFGYSREELQGAKTSLLHVNGTMWRHFKRHVRNELKQRGAVNDFELQLKRQNGTIFPAEQSVVFTSDSTGRIASSVMVVRDIGDRKRFEDELLLLPNRIMEAQESERKRVARELHDGVNQLIASAKMRLQKVEEYVVSANPAAKEMLSRSYNLMVQALEENRRIAHNLRPSDLDELGLTAACRNFCEQVRSRTRLNFVYDFGGFHRRLLPDAELNLFRILQEAVTNIEKHAKANSVHVRLVVQSDSVILQVKDDGQGFEAVRTRADEGHWSGIGLTNMKERASLLGGAFDATSSLENGTTITVTAPCRLRGDISPRGGLRGPTQVGESSGSLGKPID